MSEFSMEKHDHGGRPYSLDSLGTYGAKDPSLFVGHDPSVSSSNLIKDSPPYKGPPGDAAEATSIPAQPNKFGTEQNVEELRAEKPPFRSPSFVPLVMSNKWLCEILAIIFSIGCMVTVVVLALRLQGTWLSRWTFVLKPNTLIAILVTAAQSSMMLVVAEVLGQLKWLHMSLPKHKPTLVDLEVFESASRGPMGSLGLFCRWKPQTVTLTSLVYAASLITILGLAMGPFAQQTVDLNMTSPEPREHANATMAVSNQYNRSRDTNGLDFSVAESGQVFAGMTSITDLDMAADMQGAFYSGIYGLDRTFVDFGCPSNCSWGTFTTMGLCSTCQDVSASTKLMNTTNRNSYQTPGGWNLTFTIWTTATAASNFTFRSLDTLSAQLISFVVMQSGSTDPSRSYTVTECSVSWCAKQYSDMRVIDGELQNQYSVLELPLWPVKGQDFGGLARGQATSTNWMFTLTPDRDGGIASTAPAPFNHSGFNVSIYDHYAISTFLSQKFNFSSESKTSFLSSGEDVISTMENITASMTKRIPNSDSGTVARGILYQQQTIIQIHFAWLSLPLALVLCSAILLLATVKMTEHFHIPAWKTSPLPFLYHGIKDRDDNDERDLVEGRLENLNVMKDRADLTRVRMFQSPQGGTWLAR